VAGLLAALAGLGLAEGVAALLSGQTAVACIQGEPVEAAKALRDFAKTNPNLVVKGGLLGTGILTAKEATALADIPPREVLLARLAGGLAAPLQQFAGLLQALPRNLAYGLSALIEKQGGAPEAAAEPEPAPAAEAETAAPEEAAEPPAAEVTEAPAAEAEAPAADEATEAPAANETAPDQSEETQQESE
jgi:large subunit ribosomal protein L10